MMVQRDRLAFVIEKQVTFGNDGLTVLVADSRVALARYAATAKVHVRGTARYVTAVLQFVAYADWIIHLLLLSLNSVEHRARYAFTCCSATSDLAQSDSL